MIPVSENIKTTAPYVPGKPIEELGAAAKDAVAWVVFSAINRGRATRCGKPSSQRSLATRK